MISRKWLVIGAIIIVLAAVSAAVLLSEQSNTTITNITNNSNNSSQSQQPTAITISVETNGSGATVTASAPLFTSVPKEMTTELKSKANKDVQSDSSTVDSLKADMEAIAKKYNYTATVTLKSQFGVNTLPFPATVSGTSMIPTLQDGQNIMAIKTKDIKVGDIVISKHPTYGLIVKRVAQISNGKVYLKSDNRKVEVTTQQHDLGNGTIEEITTTKTPLDTWQPLSNIIGVVKL